MLADEDHRRVTDGSVGDEVDHLADRRLVAVLEAHPDDAVGAGEGVDHVAAVGDRRAQRLLGEHVHRILGDVDQQVVVEVVGCRQHHCITEAALEHLDVIVEQGQPVEGGAEVVPRPAVRIGARGDHGAVERLDVEHVLHTHVPAPDDPVPDGFHH